MAYFDGLNEVILTAALISPKKGVFQSHIGFLLCLTTAVDITILGVSFTGKFTRDYCDLLEITRLESAFPVTLLEITLKLLEI